MAPEETCHPAFPDAEEPLISYGLPFPETCRKHINEKFHASKIYIICSGSLARNTSNLQDLQHALSGKVAGVRIGLKPHTFISEVLQIVEDARKVDADLIITLGGGSLIDAAKAVAFVSKYPWHKSFSIQLPDVYQALGNDVHTESDLMALPHSSNPTPPANPPKCPIISITTSLSGGEFSNYAGVTRDRDDQKFQLSGPLKGPRLIIMDAKLALTTPLDIWLQSGFRAIDHCVEPFCNPNCVGVVREACIKGLQCLIPALLICKSDPSNAEARHQCQLGVPLAMTFIHIMVFPGASHGIGHMLGPLGVGHGHTSCILLPAVCKWNARQNVANVERQELMAKVFWDMDVARKRFEAQGLEQGKADLGDLIDAVARELGMPRSLEEVGVGRDKFEALAVNSLEDLCTKANPAKIDKKEQVLEILDMCA